MSDLSELQKHLLRELYHISDQQGYRRTDYVAWGAERGLTEVESVRLFDELKARGLAEKPVFAFMAQITTRGMLYAEEAGLIEESLLTARYTFRTEFLLHLAEVREEFGIHAYEDWEHILRARNLDEAPFTFNSRLLVECGLIENATIRGFRITQKGYDEIVQVRRRRSLLVRLESLQDGVSVTPQRRGHELEVLIFEAVKDQGWKATLNPLSKGEENDLLIHRDFVTFVVSCKWLNKRVGTDAVINLRERVTQRPGSMGLLLSMSGFAETAVSKITSRIESALVLPFGPVDIEGVVGGRFDELLEAKRLAAMDHMRFDWS